MSDMLVKLYDLPDNSENIKKLEEQGIYIKRALAPDKFKVVEYVRETFGDGWASECDVAFSNSPISCFIAVQDKKVIGFACYDATCKDFFGPTGIDENVRGKGIGKALLLACLHAMYEQGYAYAIIGGTGGAIPFYQKVAGATVIEDSVPGIYGRMIRY
ncbi:MAG: GNAT family N-acetyltransferase [Xylanivirga thermophila]|jgi:GNAT superfamily N-acetyltransferase|uniref:GNAT family N-acetyltransferase n=1 Tax=Xylanivirga thermophila TaxID=2496273 RepID=UPI00101E1B40|nr:GNAT family N-acetyltransferase [Xylanivirga thermophila]